MFNSCRHVATIIEYNGMVMVVDDGDGGGGGSGGGVMAPCFSILYFRVASNFETIKWHNDIPSILMLVDTEFKPIDGQFISSFCIFFFFLFFRLCAASYRSIITSSIHRATKAKNSSRLIYKVARFSLKSFSIVRSKALMHWKSKHVMEHRRHDQTAMDNPIQVRNTNTNTHRGAQALQLQFVFFLLFFFRFNSFFASIFAHLRKESYGLLGAARIESQSSCNCEICVNFELSK